ncbi:MAG: MFS transporter, partial [Burkholderiales bacterium]
MTRGGLAAYAALGLPLAMAMLPIYMLSPKFYGDALGVDLAALGAVLFLVRLLDTAQDPLIGRLVDFLHRRKSGWTALVLAAAVGLACGF